MFGREIKGKIEMITMMIGVTGGRSLFIQVGRGKILPSDVARCECVGGFWYWYWYWYWYWLLLMG